MFGPDFVSITKSEERDWMVMKPEIFEILMNYFSIEGSQLIDEEDVTAHEQQDESDLDEISKQIKALLNEKVRPIIVNDGGDIQFVGFNDGIVSVKLKGACVGCPSSTITLKNGIENMLKFYIPEVEKVEDISASNTNSLDEHDFMLKMPKKDGN
ncbi:hypothetical protein ACOME3_005534 [Neoechinorhynchus agilis]